MKKIDISILVSCALMFILTGSSVTVLSRSFVDPVLADIPDTDSSVSCMSSEEFPDEIVLAKQDKEKDKCLESCEKTQYRCETANRKESRIGAKKHWEGSRDCEKRYYSCLDKCQ